MKNLIIPVSKESHDDDEVEEHYHIESARSMKQRANQRPFATRSLCDM